MTLIRAFQTALLSILLLFGSDTVLPSELARQLAECSKERDAQQRLTCYDALANRQPLELPDFIQPTAAFLNSRLAVTPGVSDFNLTINDFVELITSAVMENKRKVVVHGWSKEDSHYILHLTMRAPVQLRFLPLQTITTQKPMSLLISPVIEGQTTDPELFVITIASMVPDDDEVQDQ